MANLLEKSVTPTTVIIPQVFLFGSHTDANRWLIYNSVQDGFTFLDARIGDQGRILLICECVVELEGVETETVEN